MRTKIECKLEGSDTSLELKHLIQLVAAKSNVVCQVRLISQRVHSFNKLALGIFKITFLVENAPCTQIQRCKFWQITWRTEYYRWPQRYHDHQTCTVQRSFSFRASRPVRSEWQLASEACDKQTGRRRLEE